MKKYIRRRLVTLEDIPPEYDEETQYLANDGYEILEDKGN